MSPNSKGCFGSSFIILKGCVSLERCYRGALGHPSARRMARKRVEFMG
jgi:hypothetical protein